MKNIYLLGATGSIGTQVLDVIREQKEYCLKSISVGKNITLTKQIIEEFKPEFVSVLEYDDMVILQKLYPHVSFGYGDEGLIEAATYSSLDGVLVNAVVGMVGLIPTIAAIKKHRNILLANKETLVVAGDIIKKMVKEYKVELIPIDSEHSAIFQCLKSGNREDVSKLIITASGGSFRNLSRNELINVTVEDALKHPNWSMGAKITIDSATMVNKGLEVIEAHHLFDMDYENIETIIHPESIIHSMVEFKDASVIAQMSIPNMRVPIQYALSYPQRLENKNFEKIDFHKLQKITFKPMDFERFPILSLAYKVGISGGIMPTVFNAANEVAVALFLNKKIKFLEIEEIIFQTVSKTTNIDNPTIEDILKVDKDVRDFLKKQYEVR